MRWIARAAGVVVVVFVTSVVAADVRLEGSGATFPNPLYQRWANEFQKVDSTVKINYQSIGSGGGIKNIIDKTVDFAGSDAPMSKKELAAAKDAVVHLPTVAGAVVPAYNIPGFNGELQLTGDIVADIYLGKITRWNDPKVLAVNPGANLPDLHITPGWRTDGSGTTFVFTNYLATQSDDFKSTIGMGKQVRWPSGQGGKGNEGVTAVVQQTPGALGYVELNYATANKIPFASVKNRDGKFVKASGESVSAAGTRAVDQMRDTLAVNIWNQPGEGAYPIAAFTYIIVYKDLGYLKDEAKAKALVRFLTWAATDGQTFAGEMGYAPLAPEVQKRVSEAIATLQWSGKSIAGAD